MKNFIRKYLYAICVFIILAIIGIFQFPKQEKLKEQLQKEGVYVIGQLVKVEGMKGGQVVTFRFDFEGKEWIDIDYKVIGKKFIGAKFLVKVVPSSPNINEIFPEYPIKDTMIVQPDKGWLTVPKEFITSFPIVNRRFP